MHGVRLALMLLVGYCSPLLAQQGKTHYLAVHFENDIFFQEDGGYTNGFAVTYGHGFKGELNAHNTPRWLLPLVKKSYINRDANTYKGISYQFGQIISTPEDISTPDLLPEQQPYAGLLMTRINFYAMNSMGNDRLGLVAGYVGPSSGAQRAQTFIHRLTGSDQPQGWDNQLHFEPVLRVEGARLKKLWRTAFSERLDMDLSGVSHGGIGNLRSDVGYTFSWRMGGGLTETYPVAMDLPGREVNPSAGMSGHHWMVFVNLEARYEFNNLLVEGNTFRDSHGVALIHERFQLGYGASITYGRWAFNYTGALSGKAYDTQPGIGKFGAITLTYRL